MEKVTDEKTVERQQNRRNFEKNDSRMQECPQKVVVTPTSLTHQRKFENSTDKQV